MIVRLFGDGAANKFRTSAGEASGNFRLNGLPAELAMESGSGAAHSLSFLVSCANSLLAFLTIGLWRFCNRAMFALTVLGKFRLDILGTRIMESEDRLIPQFRRTSFSYNTNRSRWLPTSTIRSSYRLAGTNGPAGIGWLGVGGLVRLFRFCFGLAMDAAGFVVFN